MSLDGAYEQDNVFARIVGGEIPAARIYRDDETLAFMDAYPQARGHALVIPRHSAARNLLDAEATTLETLILTVQKVARAVRLALEPQGLVVTQFNGAAAGQTVFHLHVHIIPRWAGEPLGRHAAGGAADPAELARLAAQIAARIEG